MRGERGGRRRQPPPPNPATLRDRQAGSAWRQGAMVVPEQVMTASAAVLMRPVPPPVAPANLPVPQTIVCVICRKRGVFAPALNEFPGTTALPSQAESTAAGRNRRQRFWLGFAASVPIECATGCRPLQPRGSIEAPSPVVSRGNMRVPERLSRNPPRDPRGRACAVSVIMNRP